MIRKKIYQLRKALQLRNKYNKDLGISFRDYYSLSQFAPKHYITKEVEFQGKKIKFSNPFWFLHSLEEIFVEKVYQFTPDSKPHKIIDAGANIGLGTIFLKQIFPNATITAFEPDQKIFCDLEHNVRSFKFENVSLINAAVWTGDGELNFASEGSVGGKVSEHIQSGKNITVVKSVDLKKYLLNNSIFFLKIDIEGAEYHVLKDCKALLHNVENLFIEFHNAQNDENHLDEILKWVKNAGFQYYIREAWNNMTYPFTKKINNIYGYQLQLNIFCYRK